MASITNKPVPQIAICAFHLRNVDGSIQILPAGKFDAPHGAMQGQGPWFIDKAIAQRIINRVSARINDMLIDYEHQNLLSKDNGKPVPAAGWAARNQFEWREGEGIYLKSPKWTDAAAAHIAADEYRYQSPVFSYDQKTGEVLDIFGLSLTNNPALDNMDPLELKAAAKQFTQTHEETSMNEALRKAILAALGLPEDSDLSDDALALKAATSLGALSAEHAALTTAAEKHAEEITAATTKADARVAAAKAGEPDPAKYVPVKVLEELQKDIAALTANVKDREMDNLIEIARSEGKISNPEMEKWLRSIDVAAAKSHLEFATPIAALAGQQTTGKKFGEDGNEELNADEIAVCKSTGISHEDYKKTRAEEKSTLAS